MEEITYDTPLTALMPTNDVISKIIDMELDDDIDRKEREDGTVCGGRAAEFSGTGREKAYHIARFAAFYGEDAAY